MSTLNVNTINAATSGQAVAVDVQNPKSFRNLIINGAMNIAQRGTSSTSAGYQTVDRWAMGIAGTDEAPTQAQHALTSSDTGPWEKGFRNSFHITNGNQTGGAGTGDAIEMYMTLEAQDIANSGWDYTSSSSYITFSFWVKSSVAQNFYGWWKTSDGTSQLYAFETGSLTANTWKKVTVKIPGNSNLQFDNNTDSGFHVRIIPFNGTNETGSMSLNTWAAYNSSVRNPDQTSTWYTTNDSTFEVTGLQLEVSDVATDFEHRSYAEELARCQRYFYEINGASGDTRIFPGRGQSSNSFQFCIPTPVPMRAAPTISGDNTRAFRSTTTSDSISSSTTPTLAPNYDPINAVIAMNVGGHSSTDNECANVAVYTDKMNWSAEL